MEASPGIPKDGLPLLVPLPPGFRARSIASSTQAEDVEMRYGAVLPIRIPGYWALVSWFPASNMQEMSDMDVS